MAPMTQFPHLAQSQGTTSHSSVVATVRNSINQYVTNIHSQVQGEGQGTAAAFWQQKITTKCHSAIPLIAQDISTPASQAFVERLFSVCATVSKHWRENITFHGLTYPKLTWGSSNFCLWPLIAPDFLGIPGTRIWLRLTWFIYLYGLCTRSMVQHNLFRLIRVDAS